MGTNVRRRPSSTSIGAYFRRHIGAYVIGVIATACFQLAMNRINWLSKAAIDATFGGQHSAAVRAAVTMLATAGLAFATRIVSRYVFFSAGRDVEYEIRGALLEKLHTLGSAFYRRMPVGQIMSRATNDVAQVRTLFGFGMIQSINVVFAIANVFQVMLGVSWRLTLAVSVMIPLIVLTTRGYRGQLVRRTRKAQDALGRLSALVQSSLSAVRVIRTFGLEARENARFSTANEECLQANLAVARTRGSIAPVLSASTAVGVLIFFWYGGLLLLRSKSDGGISKGDFFAFNLALAQLAWPISSLGLSYSAWQRGLACFKRLKDIFEARPEIPDTGVGVPADNAISVRGLSFKYEGRAVLDDVSFEVPCGRSVAIVGRTGSGKSTLAQLLVRLLPTPAGTVFIGNVDICDVRLKELRHRIGYAQQEAFLFSTTVARNVGFSMEDANAPESLAKIRAAAAEANVIGEVLELPEQFETVVGERGIQLSGGQRQRLALARALAFDAPVLLLDDPMSAVDAKTEAGILEALRRHAQNRTLLLVTNRVAAAASCDEILVLENGRIVARGTHDDLVRQGGLYAAFATQQTGPSNGAESGRIFDAISVGGPTE